MKIANALVALTLTFVSLSAFASAPACEELFNSAPKPRLTLNERAIQFLADANLVHPDGSANGKFYVHGRLKEMGPIEDSLGRLQPSLTSPVVEDLTIEVDRDHAWVRFGQFTSFNRDVHFDSYRIVSLRNDRLVFIEDVSIYGSETFSITRTIVDGKTIWVVQGTFDWKQKFLTGILNQQNY